MFLLMRMQVLLNFFLTFHLLSIPPLPAPRLLLLLLVQILSCCQTLESSGFLDASEERGKVGLGL